MSIATTSSIAPTSLIRIGATILGIAATFPIATPKSPSTSAMRNGRLLENCIKAKRRRGAATWRRRRWPKPVATRKPSPPQRQNLQPTRSRPGQSKSAAAHPNQAGKGKSAAAARGKQSAKTKTAESTRHAARPKQAGPTRTAAHRPPVSGYKAMRAPQGRAVRSGGGGHRMGMGGGGRGGGGRGGRR